MCVDLVCISFYDVQQLRLFVAVYDEWMFEAASRRPSLAPVLLVLLSWFAVRWSEFPNAGNANRISLVGCVKGSSPTGSVPAAAAAYGTQLLKQDSLQSGGGKRSGGRHNGHAGHPGTLYREQTPIHQQTHMHTQSRAQTNYQPYIQQDTIPSICKIVAYSLCTRTLIQPLPIELISK